MCDLCFEGGTFALYSLLCRYAKLRILPNHQEMDEKLSTYAMGSPGETRQSAAVKSFFEKHPKSQKCLLLFVLLGTCMAIGDSVLTPTISGEFPRELLCNEPLTKSSSLDKYSFQTLWFLAVLSAVSGVKLKIPNLHESMSESVFAYFDRIYTISRLMSSFVSLILNSRLCCHHRMYHLGGDILSPALWYT